MEGFRPSGLDPATPEWDDRPLWAQADMRGARSVRRHLGLDVLAGNGALAARVTLPLGRDCAHLTSSDGSAWKITAVGSAWRFSVVDARSGEPAATFVRARVRTRGALRLLRSNDDLSLIRGGIMRVTWRLAARDGAPIAGFPVCSGDDGVARRFSTEAAVGYGDRLRLALPLALWIAAEIDRSDVGGGGG
jgi:hypothetical protein